MSDQNLINEAYPQEPQLDANSSVWLTGFWGFSPEEEGFLGFTDERDRNRLFSQIGERQLVTIYGAASPETDNNLVHHLLGVIEVERTKIDSWQRMSEEAKQRNIELERQDKWRFAMPVRRAWRTKYNLDVKQVFPRSYDPSNGRYIARFGTWLVPSEAHWLLTNVPFVRVNVFGEVPAISKKQVAEQASLETQLQPAAGVFGNFGERSFSIEDKPHTLYLAHFPDSANLLAGKQLERGKGVFKIGITGNLKNRLRALNLSFPVTSSIGWKILRTAKFPNRASAADAETSFKIQAIENHEGLSLGREFFVMEHEKSESLFNSLSPASGLDIRVRD